MDFLNALNALDAWNSLDFLNVSDALDFLNAVNVSDALNEYAADFTPSVLSIISASAVFLDIVAINAMRIGTLQFVLYLMILLTTLLAVACKRWLVEMYDVLVMKAIEYVKLALAVVDMWSIILFDECLLDVFSAFRDCSQIRPRIA